MTDRRPSPVLDGLAFAEGPRWREGRLWFSDMHAHRVLAFDPQSGATEEIVRVSTQPSGLGWMPDGTLLVVSMTDRRVLRRGPDGRLTLHADLSALAPFHCNDMVVDATGRAYVGNFGFDLYDEGAPRRPTGLAAVEPDGTPRIVAEELWFPNGMAIAPDGRTLVVAESFAARLTAFALAPDGSLGDRRTFAQLEGAVPDGICLDAEGAVWLASPVSHECVRVAEGGRVLDRVRVEGERQAYACMLGGPDRRTLFVCTAFDSHPERTRAERAGRIETVRVEVPGAGLP